MPDPLSRNLQAAGNEPDLREEDSLRQLSRSPHPYHLNSDIPEASTRFTYRPTTDTTPGDTPPDTAPGTSLSSISKTDDSSETASPFPSFTKDSTPASDSGTEADDEHFSRGLPAPKVRLHKGLRGEPFSSTSSPALTPRVIEEEGDQTAPIDQEALDKKLSFWEDRNYRRSKELFRRTLELIITGGLFAIVRSNESVKPLFATWKYELGYLVLVTVALLLLYPLRLIAWTYQHREPTKTIPIAIPTVFDPAPILYPSAVALLVAFLIAVDNPAIILPNIVLGLSSIPKLLMPTARYYELVNNLHWVLTCLPIFFTANQPLKLSADDHVHPTARPVVGPEALALLYPLHQSLVWVLYYLTTTSLLTAELQLLSIALINVLLLSHSPQANILRTLLWIGGVLVLTISGPIIRWGIALARVPRLRFRREMMPQNRSWFGLVKDVLNPRFYRNHPPRHLMDDTASETLDSDDEGSTLASGISRVRTFALGESSPPRASLDGSISRSNSARTTSASAAPVGSSLSRSGTFPNGVSLPKRSATHTFSGRRKRTSSRTVRSFFKFTQTQAFVRKWVYSAYVHFTLMVIILGPVRHYIGANALSGYEPIGWAVGYLFGDISKLRFQVLTADLERWILLPPRVDDTQACCGQGWVQHIRHVDFGEANTRLFICAYWLTVVIFGLVVVIRLDPKYEVDTRRKVFHFMMVAMFLPATYVDPVFAALALSFALAIFLILDLLRASQLPPLSRPIASFLTPYVDGRDHKGPVVISHIFLLIGCAIPLWLTLATLPRTTPAGFEEDGVPADPLAGWEVPTREVSVVAGVICVGLGDAAASLIGRRYGHKKWLWGGGKSLEGSVAFAAAVFVGLMVATSWLRIGRWPVSPGHDISMPVSVRNSAVCATMASLTEAVLTGGNDNVIVPVALWTCVKSLGI